MPVTYEPADEVRRVAQRMIDKYHPDLRAVRIEYVFRSKASKRHGRVVAGSAKKVTGVNALLATDGAQSSEDLAFFLVTIAKDIWETLEPSKREALVDHELEHCRVEVDEDGFASLVMRGHDIEEFSSIVGRHGLWSDDLEWFVTSLPAEQMNLLGTSVTISHVDGNGVEQSVDTTVGGLSRAAQMLRHGSGVLDKDRAARVMAGEEDPGQAPDPAVTPED